MGKRIISGFIVISLALLICLLSTFSATRDNSCAATQLDTISFIKLSANEDMISTDTAQAHKTLNHGDRADVGRYPSTRLQMIRSPMSLDSGVAARLNIWDPSISSMSVTIRAPTVAQLYGVNNDHDTGGSPGLFNYMYIGFHGSRIESDVGLQVSCNPVTGLPRGLYPYWLINNNRYTITYTSSSIELETGQSISGTPLYLLSGNGIDRDIDLELQLNDDNRIQASVTGMAQWGADGATGIIRTVMVSQDLADIELSDITRWKAVNTLTPVDGQLVSEDARSETKWLNFSVNGGGLRLDICNAEQYRCNISATYKNTNFLDTLTFTINTPMFPFSDIPANHWAFPHVAYMFDNGIMLGTTDTAFAPNEYLSRAMAASILWRMEESPVISFEPIFSDVPASAPDWYRTAVVWAYYNGVIQGHADGCFSPNDDITREQFVTMLYRYALRRALQDSLTPSGHMPFQDAGQISNWAREAMQWAVGNGIIHGTNTGAINPHGITTRAECAAILHRFDWR